MLGKDLCDFISWQLRFRNLFGEKGRRPQANEAKPSHRKGKATTYENNETQPVTIGYRLGFESVYRTRTIEHLAISSAACTRKPGLSRCFEPSSANVACIPGTARHGTARHAMHRSCMRAQLGSIKRGSHLHPRHPTPSAPRAHAIDLRCQSQTMPGHPAPGRAGCLPACPSCAPGPRRPQPRGWFPRCRSGFRRTTCPPR